MEKSLEHQLSGLTNILDNNAEHDSVPPANNNSNYPQLSPSSIQECIGAKKKVWIEAYGCSASMADSEMIAGLLKNGGYEIATDEAEASLNLIVTCSVKDATEQKMLYKIDKFSKSGKPLVVAGCLPKADRKRVESITPSASLVGANSIDKAVDVVNSTISGQKMVVLEDSLSDKINLPRIRLNPAISIVEIASGCMSECSFCQTKLVKGWIKSYSIGNIMRQIQNDVQEGCREIWLSSTDNGCYGKDIGSNLVQLLESCCTIDGDYKIRVGMMNPMYLPSMIERLVKLFAYNNKIFKFLHIPVQSGSDRILRKMKRGHSVKIFHDAVKIFRSKIPEITIATDVIAGFPSETEEDFQQTLTLIKETQPDIVNISGYSARPGTTSVKLKKVSSNIVKDRTKKLHLLTREIARRRNSLWKGWRGEIIVDEIKDNIPQGRNYAYKPVLVLSPSSQPISSILLKPTYTGFSIGNKIIVQIDNYSDRTLRGTSIN